jgi:hypothetical protein
MLETIESGVNYNADGAEAPYEVVKCTDCNWKGRNPLKVNERFKGHDQDGDPVYEYDKACPRCTLELEDGYQLEERLRTYSDPDNKDLRVLGDTLLGTYSRAEWMVRIEQIIEQIKDFQSNGVSPETEYDSEYVSGVRDCIQASMHDGSLRDYTKNYSGRRKAVYDAINLLNEFLGEK